MLALVSARPAPELSLEEIEKGKSFKKTTRNSATPLLHLLVHILNFYSPKMLSMSLFSRFLVDLFGETSYVL